MVAHLSPQCWRRSVMRQVGDTLVWLAMIGVVAAVVYFTPRIANYVGTVSDQHPRCDARRTRSFTSRLTGPLFKLSRTQWRRPSA